MPPQQLGTPGPVHVTGRLGLMVLRTLAAAGAAVWARVAAPTSKSLLAASSLPVPSSLRRLGWFRIVGVCCRLAMGGGNVVVKGCCGATCSASRICLSQRKQNHFVRFFRTATAAHQRCRPGNLHQR